jgi:hypothetical protein
LDYGAPVPALAASLIGMATSGWGICGPRYPALFVITLVGLVCFIAGLLLVLAAFSKIAIRKPIRKLRVLYSSAEK